MIKLFLVIHFTTIRIRHHDVGDVIYSSILLKVIGTSPITLNVKYRYYIRQKLNGLLGMDTKSFNGVTFNSYNNLNASTYCASMIAILIIKAMTYYQETSADYDKCAPIFSTLK